MRPEPDEIHTLEGSCHCGNVKMEVGLTRAPGAYTPRACDCDFCTKHGAAWLSDPNGWLRVRISNENGLQRYRQGAELADMLFCGKCGILVGACFQRGPGVFAVGNARAFEEKFGADEVVSPKVLGADEKTERWKEIWFRDVKIEQRGAG